MASPSPELFFNSSTRYDYLFFYELANLRVYLRVNYTTRRSHLLSLSVKVVAQIVLYVTLFAAQSVHMQKN